jgi:hypothetical protein
MIKKDCTIQPSKSNTPLTAKISIYVSTASVGRHPDVSHNLTPLPSICETHAIVPVKTPSPYIVLRGKRHELIKLFSLRSLISLTLKKFRIHNPRREINGFTIQYRASDNDTTVEDMYAKIAQSCPYLVVKDKTSAVRVIWVVKDVEAGKSAVETSYSDLNLVFDKSDSISISPPNPDATHVQPVPTAATSTGLSAVMLKSPRVRDRSNDTVIPPSAKRKTKKPVGTTVSEDEVESPAFGIGDPEFFEDGIEYPAVACFDSVRNEAISVTSKRMKARLRKLDMPLPEEVQADKQKTRRVSLPSFLATPFPRLELTYPTTIPCCRFARRSCGILRRRSDFLK